MIALIEKIPTDKGRNMGFLDKAKDLLAQNAGTK